VATGEGATIDVALTLALLAAFASFAFVKVQAGGDCHHRPQVERLGEAQGLSSPGAAPPACALTKANEAKAASSASVNATSIVAPSPVATPTSSTPAQDADQSQADHGQDEDGGAQQEFSHAVGRQPGPS
jgi:hypothetical protein